jgi:hypothetical protein
MTNTNYSLTIDQAQRIAKEAGVVLEPRDGTEQNFDVVDAEGDRLNDFTYSRHDIRSMSERECIPGGKVIECQKVEEPTLVLNRSKFGLGKKDVSKVVER